MDGFHLSNASLRQRGLADRKGSPPTFDVLAYARLLRATREGDSPLPFPVYDRQAHEPAWREDAAHRLDAAVRIVVTEGNYLLLADGAWPQVAATLDTCWYLDTPLEQARRWIIERHVRGGRSEAAAEDWYRRVDGPNAQLTLATRDRADLRVVWPGGAAPTTQTLTAS